EPIEPSICPNWASIGPSWEGSNPPAPPAPPPPKGPPGPNGPPGPPGPEPESLPGESLSSRPSSSEAENPKGWFMPQRYRHARGVGPRGEVTSVGRARHGYPVPRESQTVHPPRRPRAGSAAAGPGDVRHGAVGLDGAGAARGLARGGAGGGRRSPRVGVSHRRARAGGGRDPRDAHVAPRGRARPAACGRGRAVLARPSAGGRPAGPGLAARPLRGRGP